VAGSGAQAGSGGHVGSTGGSAGQAGSGGQSSRCVGLHTIDDLEDGDLSLCQQDGRNGYWFTYADGSAEGVLQPTNDEGKWWVNPVTGLPKNLFSARTYGEGFAEYVGFGTVLRVSPSDANQVMTYDASKYNGISFSIRGTQDMSVKVLFTTTATQPPQFGGSCVESSGKCFKHFSTTLPLTNQRKSVTVPFLSLKTERDDIVFTPSALLSILFEVTAHPEAFDVEVDDLRFTKP
jgi:hypothetical protein